VDGAITPKMARLMARLFSKRGLEITDGAYRLRMVQYQEQCGISRSTAKKELQALVTRGLLRQQGTGRYTHYILASMVIPNDH